MCSRCQLNALKKTQMSFQNFLSVLVVVYCSCWFMHQQIHIGSCCGHFCSFRTSICGSSTYNQDSVLLNILQSRTFRSFLRHGCRSTREWSVRNVTKSCRFALQYVLNCLSYFFSVLYVQFEHEQSGDFRFSLESSFLPLQSDYAVLNVKMIELSELGVLV